MTTNDEREALAQVTSDTLAPLLGQSPTGPDETDYELADAILAAGFTRHPAPPASQWSEEDVEKACRAYWDRQPGDGYPWDEMAAEDPNRADLWREDMRAALAALTPRSTAEPRVVRTVEELRNRLLAERSGFIAVTDSGRRAWIIWESDDGDLLASSWPDEDAALDDDWRGWCRVDAESLLPATVLTPGVRNA